MKYIYNIENKWLVCKLGRCLFGFTSIIFYYVLKSIYDINL